ncbi:MAG: phosphoribosylanthranilate isomerase [Calditrichaceae bacterium]
MVRIKVCCISSVEEARMAVEAGASALGLVSEMPSGPGVITEEMISVIAATIPPAVGSFLLTSKKTADQIIKQQKKCGVNTIQICDSIELNEYRLLRQALPGISLVQVIHVRNEHSLDEAVTVAPFVNGILLDSGNPDLSVKELGGTGRVHNWDISRQIVEQAPVPVFLAGGLKPENVAEAIRNVKPYGVDVCSGLRINGKLDSQKLQEFCENARLADNN